MLFSVLVVLSVVVSVVMFLFLLVVLDLKCGGRPLTVRTLWGMPVRSGTRGACVPPTPTFATVVGCLLRSHVHLAASRIWTTR